MEKGACTRSAERSTAISHTTSPEGGTRTHTCSPPASVRSLARPARTLFQDVRPFLELSAQARAWHVVDAYVKLAIDTIERMPKNGYDVNGNPLQCRATTRRGTPCQRVPLHHNGYCPSHQHLAETEELDSGAPIAA